jgi:hypothetical protein
MDVAVAVTVSGASAHVALNGADDGSTIDESLVELTALPGQSATDVLIGTMIATHHQLASGGHRLVATTINWPDRRQAAGLRDKLTAAGLTGVTVQTDAPVMPPTPADTAPIAVSPAPADTAPIAASPAPPAPTSPGAGGDPAAATTANIPVQRPDPAVHNPFAPATLTLPRIPAPPASRNPLLVILAVVAVVAVAVAIWPSHANSPSSVSAPSPGSGRGSTTAAPTPSTSGSTSAGTTMTFAEMRDIVTNLYGQLPQNASTAFGELSGQYGAKTGYQDYLNFWASIASVTVLSVTPRDATSVTARLRYVTRSGATDTEDRWLSFVKQNGGLLVSDSERIGSA